MELTPTQNVKVDEEGREISQYSLSLPTILRQILEQFSNRELIQLSLVNKLWNFEARSVMKERGSLGASIRFGNEDSEVCTSLEAFASDLKKMRVVPFAGLRLAVNHRDDRDTCQSFSDGSFPPSYQIILDQLHWKKFSVRFPNDWERCKGCPALTLVKKILENYCGILEELSLELGNEEYYRTILQHRSFPCLQILTVEKNFGRRESLTNGFIKSLVSRAPKLQELHIEGDNNFAENVLEGSSAVLFPGSVFRSLSDQVCESLIPSVRAEYIDIRFQDEDSDPELLRSFIPKLLQASHTTLKALYMDLLVAVPLMCYGICLENVETLEIRMNCYPVEELEPSVLKLVTGFDFHRVFPSLTYVTVQDYEDAGISSGVISTFVEQGTAVLNRAFKNQTSIIESLELDVGMPIKDSTFLLLAQMFPKVKTVYRNGHEPTFLVLREHFPCLEEVFG